MLVVEAPRGWLEGLLLVADTHRLYGINALSGKTAWVRDLGELPSDLCEGRGYAGLRFSNGRFEALAMATGARVNGDASRCQPIVTSRSVAPNFSIVEGAALPSLVPERPPLRPERALVPHRGVARVLLGSAPAAPAAALAAEGAARVAVTSEESWLWDARLGRESAARAHLLTPALAAVRRERVVVPYVLSSPPELRLASLDLGSGRLLWDQLLSTSAVAQHSERAELRISSSGRIYFSNGTGQLWVIELDGQPIWQIGQP